MKKRGKLNGFFLKSVTLTVGFLIFVVQPISVAVQLISNQKKEISTIEIDKEQKENQNDDFDSEYLNILTTLTSSFIYLQYQYNYNLYFNFFYSNNSIEIVIPPPQKLA